jgi:hypothetical protein
VNQVTALNNNSPLAFAETGSSRDCDFRASVIRDVGGLLGLFRIEAQGLELPAPFSRRIAEPLDADAAGQATFHGCFDKVGCEEGERDRHVDLPNAALLPRAEFADAGYSTRNHII